MSPLPKLECLDASAREKKDAANSNRFHLLPIRHGRDRSTSSFNLNFNRRTLTRTELREPSPRSTSRASSQSDHQLSQTCGKSCDSESLTSELSKWRFPCEPPVPHRQIIWGPYFTDDETESVSRWPTTPKDVNMCQPEGHFPPSPTSLKRSRNQVGIDLESQRNYNSINLREPKRSRRNLSETSEVAFDQLSSPTILSPTTQRLEQVFSLLENLTPHPEPPPPYYLEYRGSLVPSYIREHPDSNLPNSDFDSSTYLRQRFSSRTPSPLTSRGLYQTFGWYRPENVDQPNWWDYSPSSRSLPK